MDRINFYMNQLVSESDFTLWQDNIESMFTSLIEDLGLQYAYNGLDPIQTYPASMAITAPAGRVYFGDGRHGVLETAQTVSLASAINTQDLTAVQTPGYQRWISVLASYAPASDTPIINPAGDIINYRTYGSTTFSVIAATEAVAGLAQRPDWSTYDPLAVLLCDVLLSYGQTTIATAQLDQTRILSRPGNKRACFPYLLNTLDNTRTRLAALETLTTQEVADLHSDVQVLQDNMLNRIYDIQALQVGKSDVGHPHVIEDVSGLQTALDNKMDASYVFPIEVPAGVIVPFAGSNCPSGWLWCTGSTVSRTQYADLFAALGTKYGAGDGYTTFALPDLTGRFPLGGSATYAQGATGGAATHTLTLEEIASHSHSPLYLDGSNIDNGDPGPLVVTAGGDANGLQTSTDSHTADAGGGEPHNNMPPFLSLLYIIKAVNTGSPEIITPQ